MRKILLIIFLCASIKSHAQVCTPVWTDTTYGIIPDTFTNLPIAYVNVPYDVVVQFRVPLTAPYGTDTFDIHRIILTGVDGLSAIPASVPFYFNCNPSDCEFFADSVGCVRIQGTPNTAGEYSLTINANVYITPNAYLPFPTEGYRILVYTNIGIPPVSETYFDVSQNTPNPFSSATTIYVNLVNPGNFNVTVSDLAGRELLHKTYSGRKGINEIPLEIDLSTGIYSYTVNNGEQSVTKRMIVQ